MLAKIYSDSVEAVLSTPRSLPQPFDPSACAPTSQGMRFPSPFWAEFTAVPGSAKMSHRRTSSLSSQPCLGFLSQAEVQDITALTHVIFQHLKWAPNGHKALTSQTLSRRSLPGDAVGQVPCRSTACSWTDGLQTRRSTRRTLCGLLRSETPRQERAQLLRALCRSPGPPQARASRETLSCGASSEVQAPDPL